jgi:hypothetical protein
MKYYMASELDDFLEWPRHWKIVMRFGMWNIRSLYRAGSLKTAASELTKYKLDLVGVQEIWWDNSGSQPGSYIFFCENGNAILKREETVAGGRRLHNEELHNLYASRNISVMKTRMRWVRHVACMRHEKCIHCDQKEKNHSEDLCIDGRIMLAWILGK